MKRKAIKIIDIWVDYVICQECGEKFKQLAKHIKGRHSMTVAQYRKKHPGFPIQCGKIAKQAKGKNSYNFGNSARYVQRQKTKNCVKEGIEGIDFVTCQECGEKRRMLTTSGHLVKHHMTRAEYKVKYPNAKLVCQDFADNENPISRLSAESGNSKTNRELTDELYKGRLFTKIHKSIHELLNIMGILHLNEALRFGRNLDIMIDDTHFIEVQGDYWHCNPIKYPEPVNSVQERDVGLDVIKANVFNKRGIKILYLWEYDIEHRLDLCELLIKKYVDNKLNNFHSFNYTDIGELDIKYNFYY